MEESIPFFVHMTGPHRGSVTVLEDDVLRLGTGASAELHFPEEPDSPVARRHALLERRDSDLWIERRSDGALFVNGDAAERRHLEPGDVVELGRGGPMLRYREGEISGDEFHKTLRQALADCVDCVRYGSDSLSTRIGTFLRAMPRELLTQTSPWTRASLVLGLGLVLTATGYLFVQNREIDRRLDVERARLRAVAASLRAERSRPDVSPALLDSLRSTLSRRADTAAGDGASARSRVRGAIPAVVFIQGSFFHVDPETGRPVRVRPGGRRADGGPGGDPPVGTDVSGPVLERTYTGTGFVATNDGLVLTNRHIVRPWRQDRIGRSLAEMGYEPRLRRLRGYLPGREEPFELKIVASSDSADLSLLRCSGVTAEVPALELADGPPEPGDEIYVLGYPTGIRAMLARSQPDLVGRPSSDSVSSWELARRLARSDLIRPLVTRGIVGQRTAISVVYDAQTTQGGSGGPVLDEDGEVVAINRAVMREFGGSNIGVPVRFARRLIQRARRD